jgi:predicted membrane channel-forming protein YqfA (hemolysin III family)
MNKNGGNSLNFRFKAAELSQLQEVVPICQNIDDDEQSCNIVLQSKTIGGPKRFSTYEIDDLKSIWCRVMCKNTQTNVPKDSLLGPNGHVERMNVWTHLIAATVYLLHLSFRYMYTQSRSSLTNDLVSFQSASFVITFIVSSTYHVYSANYFWSAVTRLGDYACIYLSISSTYLVDISVSTNNLEGVPWQSAADTWIAAIAMVAFFILRRVMLPISDTRLPYLGDRCSFGLARNSNVDLEHSSLRAGAGLIMAFSWILATPGVFNVIELDCAIVFLCSNIFGVLLLLLGMGIDNVLLYPDTWFRDKGKKPTACVCYSSDPGCGGGWIMTSHALWHIVSVLSTVITTVGLEYVILNSDVLL